MNREDNAPRLTLPASLKAAYEPRALAGQYFTYEDLTGARSSISELSALLATVRRSDAICWSAALLEAVSKKDGLDPHQQMALARDLFDDSLLDQLRKEAATPDRWVVFHRRQLWLFLQLSMVICSERSASADDRTIRRTIGKACLMVSDFLHQVEQVHVPAPPEGAALEWLITVLVSHVDISHGNELLARSRFFWVDSIRDPAIYEKFEKLNAGSDLDAAFERRYGIPLSEFIFVASVLYCGFLQSANQTPISPGLIDSSQWAAGVFSDEVKKKVFGLLSISADDFAAYLFGTPRQSWATDKSPLLRYPLIEVNPGQYACPDLSLFRLFFVDGVFWLLNDAIDSTAWRPFFGDIFEWYITMLIESFTVSSERLIRTFFRATKFQGTEDQVCDGLIHWGEHCCALRI